MHESTFPIHSPPDPVALPGLAHPVPAPFRPRELALALLGLLALGGAAALGGPAMGPGLRLIPSVLLVELPALGLTAPALIAAHQFLRLGAAPEQLAAALGRALIHAGRVAGGLAVVVLFFAATTRLATPMLAVALAGVGVFTSATACVELTAVERRAARTVAPAFTLLLIGWLSLSWLVALRVGADVAMWVLGYGGMRA
ncbi:MAG TPA: hypothetical protein VM869_31360 [Enhygromyxa sp.]|nr:hypothetical protein [Enhygromyxa sp.]